MEKKTLKTILERAIESLLSDQRRFAEFTPATRQTEWNLGHHVGQQIQHVFHEYDMDFDVRKVGAGNRRPDIVFHRHGTHRKNFLVVELKRNGGPSAIQKDIKKIKTYWFRRPLRYRFGAVTNIREKNRTAEIIVLANSPARPHPLLKDRRPVGH